MNSTSTENVMPNFGKNKPFWHQKHEWALDDITVFMKESWLLKLMIRRNPDNEIGDLSRKHLKESEKNVQKQIAEYVKIYGTRPNTRKLREAVEKETETT